MRIARVRRDPLVRRIALSTSQLTVGFFERLGFQTTEIVKDGYGPELDRHDMVLETERAETAEE